MCIRDSFKVEEFFETALELPLTVSETPELTWTGRELRRGCSTLVEDGAGGVVGATCGEPDLSGEACVVSRFTATEGAIETGAEAGVVTGWAVFCGAD